MKVILLQDIKSLGKRGDIKEVAEGYARNYLLPKGLVAEANKANMNMLQHEKELKANKEARILADAKQLAQRLQDTVWTIEAKCGDGGRLFGSITNADVADALAKDGIDIDKRKVEIAESIKTIGRYQIILRLHSQVQCQIFLDVVAKQ
ncbi:MAG: 50S ribosomal protein L9 [Bacillota bacterium]|jgi:large subunit ribosomal protein L9